MAPALSPKEEFRAQLRDCESWCVADHQHDVADAMHKSAAIEIHTTDRGTLSVALFRGHDDSEFDKDWAEGSVQPDWAEARVLLDDGDSLTVEEAEKLGMALYTAAILGRSAAAHRGEAPLGDGVALHDFLKLLRQEDHGEYIVDGLVWALLTHYVRPASIWQVVRAGDVGALEDLIFEPEGVAEAFLTLVPDRDE